MNMDRKPLATLAVLALAGVLLSAVVLVGGADAAKGGQGKGNGPPAPHTVTLSVSPVSPTGGQAFAISGSGFTPGAAVNFALGSAGTYTHADANGFAWTPWTIALPGTYTMTSEENTGRGYEQVGSITFNVVP